MKKTKLLKTAPLKATAGMLAMAAADRGEEKIARRTYGRGYSYIHYQTRLYFRARKIDDVLEVDIYTRNELSRKIITPSFRIFLDVKNNEFATYVCSEERWSNAKIDMLEYDDNHVLYSSKPPEQSAPAVKRLVNTYFGTGYNFSVAKAVLDFQLSVRSEQLSRKHKLITDTIDEDMAMIPPLPKDFDKWIFKTGLNKMHYLFYAKDKNSGYCEVCDREVAIIKNKPLLKHNEAGRCEACGSSVIYKSWNRQKCTEDRTCVSILQKCTDGEHIVCRQFSIKKTNHKERFYMPEISRHEDFRTILDKEMHICTSYEFGEFKSTGIMRWCDYGSVNHGGYCGYYYTRATASLYHNNLASVLNDTGFRYMPVKELLMINPGVRFEVEKVLREMYLNRDMYEPLFKCGLKKFVYERLIKKCELTKPDRYAKKPWQKLRIDKEAFKQTVRLDATDRQLRIIQKVSNLGVRLTDEQIIWIDTYIGVSEILNYFRLQTPHKIIRYLKEKVEAEMHPCAEEERNEMMHFYVDYLDTARQLDWDLRDRQLFFPQDIKRAHDEASALMLIEAEKKEALEKQEQDMQMKENAKDIRRVFNYEDDDFLIAVPESFADFKKEGHNQHNCVATYYERAVNKKLIILFIRKKSEPDKSFCTVEIGQKGGAFTIVQNRIIYNGEAPEEAKEFMEKTVKEAQENWHKIYTAHNRATVESITVAV